MWPNNNFQEFGNQDFLDFLDAGQSYQPNTRPSAAAFALDPGINYNETNSNDSDAFSQNQAILPAFNNTSVAMDTSPQRNSSPASQSSQSGVPNKVQLNARAAELKEKLRKRRELQGQQAVSSGAPAAGSRPATPAKNGATQSPPAKPNMTSIIPNKPAAAEENQFKANRASSSVPHVLPQRVSQPVLSATGADIADLISDIRAATDPEPLAQAPTASKMADTTVAGIPPTPTGKIAKNERQGSFEEGEIRGNTPDLSDDVSTVFQTIRQPAGLPPRPTISTNSSKKLTSSTASNSKSYKYEDKQDPLRTDGTAFVRPVDQREGPTNTSSYREQQRTSSNGTTPATDIKPSGGGRQDTSALLARLLAEDEDLRDWLDFTHYHNADYRTRALARTRRLIEIEKKQQEAADLEKERQELLRQDGLEIRVGREPAIAALTPAVTIPPASEPVKVQTKYQVPSSSQPTLSKADSSKITSAVDSTAPGKVDSQPSRPTTLKREHGGDENASLRPEKLLRTDGGGRYDSYRGDANRGYSRPPSPAPRRRHTAYPYRNPNTLDLGRRGESRFFMVKSFNRENVMACMEDGLWTTQVQNGETLTSAFATCKNVILFFSINQSRAFQGYARMATAPSPDTPRPRWMNAIHWECTPPFRIEWCCTTEMPFHAVHHLVNSLNENMPVLVGKDGQEIEEQCGRDLAAEMDKLEESRKARRERDDDDRSDRDVSPPPQPRYPRGGGYGRGRGGGRGRGRARGYVKREVSP
ncbi:hypothetical protein NKR23_g3211 [Pleurostoma richardsiae]|uniref:YTH domain-containing protein n=1 Tax=Pleurostoma richardsiae TaxID=41990 RepID=A0AA38RZ95_9PEZI|nr:hypothetical protein NKR23_g3211 [Pleurostoma richardsiae]